MSANRAKHDGRRTNHGWGGTGRQHGPERGRDKKGWF